MSVEIAYAEGMLSVWMYGQLPRSGSIRVALGGASVGDPDEPIGVAPHLGDQIIPLAHPRVGAGLLPGLPAAHLANTIDPPVRPHPMAEQDFQRNG
jgi:hypothetical protein